MSNCMNASQTVFPETRGNILAKYRHEYTYQDTLPHYLTDDKKTSSVVKLKLNITKEVLRISICISYNIIQSIV